MSLIKKDILTPSQWASQKRFFFQVFGWGNHAVFIWDYSTYSYRYDSSNYINQNYPLLIWSGFEYLPLVIRRRLKGVINPPASVWFLYYCWWLKSQTTTRDVRNPTNNGGKLPFPQLVSLRDFSHQQHNKQSMYGIFTYIYHQNKSNVAKYTLHGYNKQPSAGFLPSAVWLTLKSKLRKGCRQRLQKSCPQLPFQRFDATDGRQAEGAFHPGFPPPVSHRCFLKWWYPHFTPQLLIIFCRKKPTVVGETPPFFWGKHPHCTCNLKMDGFQKVGISYARVPGHQVDHV